MGIIGLLPLMKSATTDVSLSKLQDTIAAVDTNGWIHRACYSCADKIYLNEPTEMYINYCINYCNLLRKHRITPILIFDGQSLPAKSETKLQRQKRKEQIRESIEELLRTGQESKARWWMRQCVYVTFEMVHKVIERCRQEKIDYLVAPYEADAQITYLVNNNIADYAITEDSDLMVFGCRRILYKLDRDSERGQLVDLDRLNRCFKNFDFRCDYISNIPGIGIGRSKKFFESLTQLNENINEILNKIPTILKLKVKITDEYIENFIRACNTFNHQVVYSPEIDNLTYLYPLKSDVKKIELKEYAGNFFDSSLKTENNLKFVTNYILGNICPKTLKFIDNYIPLKTTLWSSILSERINSKKNNIKSFELKRKEKMIVEGKLQEEELDNSQIKPISIRLSKKNSDDTKQLKTSIEIQKNDPKPINQSIKTNQFTILRDQGSVVSANIENTRYNRNIFRKSKKNSNCDDSIKKSKYFYPYETKVNGEKAPIDKEDDFDESEFHDIIPESKKPKPDLNISTSSIDEEDVEILAVLNRSQLTLSQRSDLSPTQRITSQSNSSELQTSQLDKDNFSCVKTSISTTRYSREKKYRNQKKRKSLRSSTLTKQLCQKSVDIRKYFN